MNCIYPGCNKELTGRQRRYCSKEHADDYFHAFISPLWWANAVKTALKRTDNKCERCGSSVNLQVHHKEKLPLDNPHWDYKKKCWGKPTANYHNNQLNRQENLIVLCRKCHDKEHTGEKQREQLKQQATLEFID